MAPSRVYPTPASIPPATEMLTPPWKPLLFGLPVWTAEPANRIRSVTSRP